MPSKKKFDAVAASRRWRARSSRELAGLSYEQLQARLRAFATADALVKPFAPRCDAQSGRFALSSA